MADGYTRSEGLSAGTAVAFAVGNMVGAGVFVLSGLMVQTAGPAAVLSYLLCGILVAFTGLSYAVLASICPGDGGGYLYAHHMLGPYPGFLAGWGMYISVTIASAFVLLGLGIYANRLLGTAFDPRIAALVGLALLTVLNLRSTAEAGRAEVALVAAKIVVLLLVAAVGVINLTPADLTPFFPHGTGAMLDGVTMVFFAYLGFQVVAMMGGEIKSSARVVPLATLASIGIVTVIYCGVEVALLAAHLPAYGDSSLFDAAVVFFGGWGGTIIAIGAIFSTLSAANANIIGGSRVILSMAAEKQIPGRFAALKGKQPANAVLLSAGVAAGLILLGNLGVIVDLTNTVALVSMGLVNISAVVLTLGHRPVPDDRTYFRIPFGPLIPLVGAGSCILMLATLPLPVLAAGGAALLAGTIFFVVEDTPEGERATAEIREFIEREGR